MQQLPRKIASYAGDILLARARAGQLDRRAVPALRALVPDGDRSTHQRLAAIRVLGALRDRESVSALGAVSSDGASPPAVRVAAVRALGEIAEPAAVPSLTIAIAAAGDAPEADDIVAEAAEALAACLATAPAPRDVSDDVLARLLAAIRAGGQASARACLAFGLIARQLEPARRDTIRSRLDGSSPGAARASTTRLGYLVARSLAGAPADVVAVAELRAAMHAGLTRVESDPDLTGRALALSLEIAAAVPDVVDPSDLVWLTRSPDATLRSRAHALLVRLGRPVPEAAMFDRATAAALDDDALATMLAEAHVIGRATLIAEADRRRAAGMQPAAQLAIQRGVIAAATDAIGCAARDAHGILDPDARALAAAVDYLSRGALDGAAVALFDRMLRHPNANVKWRLLETAPSDPRLIDGMVAVLAGGRGWQAAAARTWLARFEGRPELAAARAAAGLA